MSEWSTKGKYVKLGDVVIYVADSSNERAAIVVWVDDVQTQRATLRTLSPFSAAEDGTLSNVPRGNPSDDKPQPGTWRWRE